MLGLAERSACLIITIDIVRVAYERSAPGSKLREFILDLVRYDARRYVLGNFMDNWVNLARHCVDFGEDLVRATLFENTDVVKDPYEQRSKYLEVLTVEDT